MALPALSRNNKRPGIFTRLISDRRTWSTLMKLVFVVASISLLFFSNAPPSPSNKAAAAITTNVNADKSDDAPSYSSALSSAWKGAASVLQNSRDAIEEHTLSNTKKEGGSSSASASTSGWDSSKSVVIGLAAGYGLSVYRSFVGSLRATGFPGHIILGIAPDAPPEVLEYLSHHNVTTKTVPLGKCTYYNYTMVNGEPSTDQKCAAAYPDYKIQWGRFPLSGDWLRECKDCTDGVMLTDTRDAYFQSDPFAYVTDPKPILVFEELYPNVTTAHWLTHIPVSKCRETNMMHDDPRPMLCSGSTMGSREGILDYVDAMVAEFDYWKDRTQCRSDMIGDDQSIHNYLYYADKLPGAVPVPHRTGPIHVVGIQANEIFRSRIDAIAKEKDWGKGRAEGWLNGHRYYGTDDGDEWRNWLGPEYGLTDPKTGYILNFDGRPSPQVHQVDRFGGAFEHKYVRRMADEVWN